MSTSNLRLSVPVPRKQLPRELTDTERAAFTTIADVLLVGDSTVAAPSQHADFNHMLDVALATRSDAFDLVVQAASSAPSEPGELLAWLRNLHDERADTFQPLSAIVAGAYLMVPEVKRAVGYPGQRRNPPKPEEAIDEITDGILDPVLERGFFYVPTPGQERTK